MSTSDIEDVTNSLSNLNGFTKPKIRSVHPNSSREEILVAQLNNDHLTCHQVAKPLLPILSRRQQELDYKSKHCQQNIPMQSIRSISDYRSHPAFRCLTWKSEKCWQPPATDVKCIFSNHLVKSHSNLLQEVQQRIKEEFVRTKTDPECQEAYSSFQYLHEKLDHIKKLVHKYDQERLGSR